MYTIELNGSDKELYHYGKLGMKWGRRMKRMSQNPKATNRLMENSRGVVRESQNLNRTIGNVKNRNTKRMNLKKMSDQEMRNRINREMLERQYDDMFNPKKVGKGRRRVNDILEVAGSVVGIASSSLAIALAIKQLKGKKKK